MSALHDALHAWTAAWGSTLLTQLVVATALAAIALLIAPRVRRARATSRETLLVAAVFALAIPFPLILASWGYSGRALLDSLGGGAEATAVEITAVPVSAPVEPLSHGASSEVACAIVLVWLAGVLAMSAVWLDRAWRARRVLRGASVPEMRERQILNRVCARIGIDRFVDLARIDTLHVPCVVGTRRPRIYLPSETADELSDEELETIFAHELAHVRRRDNANAAVVALARILLWFHPLVWIAARHLEIERERACDEAALDAGISTEHYLSAFTRICNHALVSEAGVSCMSTSGLGQRMEDVMTYEARKSRFVAPRWFAMAAFGLFGIAVLSGWLLAPAVAAQETSAYTIRGTATVSGDKLVVCDIEVRDPAGVVVSAPRISVERGGKAEVVSGMQSEDPLVEREIRIEVRVDVAGAATAALEVRDGGAVVQTAQTALRSAANVAAAPAIDLQLKEAKLADVIRTFGQLTGYTIDLPPGAEGTVTIVLDDVPWTDALTRVLQPLGLRWTKVSDSRIEVRPIVAADYHRLTDYLRLDSSIAAPVAIHRVEPVYPDEARRVRVQGIVILEAQIDETGAVRDLAVLKGLPYGMNEAAMDAVRQWKFRPAMKDGVPVAVIFNLTINFKLDTGTKLPQS